MPFQGLRIAPPEAPVTGYMFGKGIYFADMVSKSANYCNTTRSNNTGLLLLCDVALGSMYERKAADYIEKLPAGKHSTKGLGKNSTARHVSLYFTFNSTSRYTGNRLSSSHLSHWKSVYADLLIAN